MRLLLVGAGGFAGAVARYGVDALVRARAGTVFPWGTFVVNVSGCFALGFLVAVLGRRMGADLRAALVVGFLGAYTTFSTFAFEAMRLGDDGAVARAALYVVGSVLLGLLAVYAGTWAGRAL